MEQTKAGFVALVGRPNAGKSTLLNWLLGEKIAIVSHKANATRKRINGIVMYQNHQIILVDTPGLHERERLLNQFMLEEALKAIGDCDLIIFLAPVYDKLDNYEKFLQLSNRPHILALTKIDEVESGKVLEKIAEYQKYSDKFLELIPISARKGVNRDALLSSIVKYLPDSPYLYDPEELTTEYIRDIYREFIREAIFEETSGEIPYESDVVIDKIEEGGEIEKIYGTIIVEKRSQKMVIVGEKGRTIKRIGKSARKKIEKFIERQVYLELFVSVKKGWSKHKKSLEEIGYIF
ncbi:MAG TPA: GTPase Era [Campylobacterales bacterium]|nr:GTPase Era [Campylobacterales bacterium]